MALPPLADLETLKAWTDVSAAEEARAGAVLSAVSARARAIARRTWTVTTGDVITLDVVPDEVEALVVEVAARYLANPEGFIRETTGPFTGERSQRAGDGVYMTDAEVAILRRYAGSSSGLWALGVTRDAGYDVAGWVPVAGSSHYFPWS